MVMVPGTRMPYLHAAVSAWACRDVLVARAGDDTGPLRRLPRLHAGNVDHVQAPRLVEALATLRELHEAAQADNAAGFSFGGGSL